MVTEQQYMNFNEVYADLMLQDCEAVLYTKKEWIHSTFVNVLFKGKSPYGVRLLFAKMTNDIYYRMISDNKHTFARIREDFPVSIDISEYLYSYSEESSNIKNWYKEKVFPSYDKTRKSANTATILYDLIVCGNNARCKREHWTDNCFIQMSKDKDRIIKKYYYRYIDGNFDIYKSSDYIPYLDDLYESDWIYITTIGNDSNYFKPESSINRIGCYMSYISAKTTLRLLYIHNANSNVKYFIRRKTWADDAKIYIDYDNDPTPKILIRTGLKI